MPTKLTTLVAILIGGVMTQPAFAGDTGGGDTGGDDDLVCIDAEDGSDCLPLDVWAAECRLTYPDDPVPDSSPCFEVDFYHVPENTPQLTHEVPPHDPQPPQTFSMPRPLLKAISVPLPPPSVGATRPSTTPRR